MLCKAGVMKWFTSRPSGGGSDGIVQLPVRHHRVLLLLWLRLGHVRETERYQLYYVVAAIWTVELIGSKIWLAHFRYGPAEWLWRSLTYWKRQPMRLRQTATAVPLGLAAQA